MPEICVESSKRLNGRVHQAHADCGAALHGIFQLIHLALANQIGDGRRIDQDFESRDTALFVGFGDQLLRNDAAQAGRQHGANMRLLVGGKRVHQPIDRGRRAIGVQRAHDQNAHLGRGDRDAHGLEIAKLAHQNDIRIFAQCRE